MGKRVAHNKLTKEKVLEQFKEVHGDGFDYSNMVYVDGHTPVEVRCIKHDFIFYPTPRNHKAGTKCTMCGREAQIEKASKGLNKFIEDGRKVYGDKDDYSLVEYTNNKNEVTISCSLHGKFDVRPDLYLQGKGCLECRRRKTKSTDKEVFLEEAFKIYGDKDDYTNTNIVSSNHTIEVRCKKHDLTFTKDISTYLGGWGCPEYSAENYRKLRAIPLEDYYKRANEIHSNKYTYNDDYTVLKDAITFFCSTHGKQRRNAHSHLIGAGCKKCNVEPFKTSRRTKEGYSKLANGRSTSLYLIECFNEDEKFYKIGKTFREIEERFSKSTMPYNYNIIHKYDCTAENIWDLEEELHIKYREYTYKPKKWFAGYSECYTLNLPTNEIKNL